MYTSKFLLFLLSVSRKNALYISLKSDIKSLFLEGDERICPRIEAVMMYVGK